MRHNPSRYFVSWLLLIFLVIGLESASHKRADESISILFVGNSLTYVNDLPALLKEIAEQDDRKISYKTFFNPNYALEDHWNQGKVQLEIEKGHYDFVLMQQGPSAAPQSQVLLLEYVQKFAAICQKANCKPAVYMVWPSRARSYDHDNVIKSYTDAAEKTSSLLCPAGLAWKYAWQSNPELPLYGPDNFHPSLMGSVAAALTIYGSFSGKNKFDFVIRERCTWRNEINEENWSVLKLAAAKALEK